MNSAKEILFVNTLENTVRNIQKGLNKILFDSPISFDQWKVLLEIHKVPGINQKSITKKLKKDKAGISRIIKKIDCEKLIVKKKIGKVHKLYLSPEGMELIQLYLPKIERYYKEVCSNIHDREFNIVEEILSRIN